MPHVTQKSYLNVFKETINTLLVNYPQFEGVKNKSIDSL